MKRTPVAYADVPPLLDQGRAGDRGRALLRASRHRLSRRDPRRDRELGIGPEVGGSTITQQVPRTLDVMKRAGLNSGFDRIVAKYKEWILAYRMEQEFTKEEILELYLNTSFFGQRSYGVATAAQTYFGKTLDELTISEIAILAGIPQRPTAMESRGQHGTRDDAPRLRAAAHAARRARSTTEQYAAALAEPIVGKEFGRAAAARSAVPRRDGASRDGRALRQRARRRPGSRSRRRSTAACKRRPIARSATR